MNHFTRKSMMASILESPDMKPPLVGSVASIQLTSHGHTNVSNRLAASTDIVKIRVGADLKN